MAVGMALDGLETTALHFTRRRHVYHPVEERRRTYLEGNSRLADRAAARAAFDAPTPYADALLRMLKAYRSYGRDDLATSIGQKSLDTAAFHFTRVPHS